MRQVVFSRRAPPRLVDVPVPALRPGAILVRTCFSAISVGTERAAADGGAAAVVRKVLERPDQARAVAAATLRDGVAPTIERVRSTLEKWLPGGYSMAGTVVAVGAEVSEFRVGDRVACGGGGYAAHAAYCAVPRRLAVRVPEGVDLEHAAFATIGAVAMQGYRISGAALGEFSAVIGLGIIGQLLCQIASAGGSIVIPMDRDPRRVALASGLLGRNGITVGSGSESQEMLALTGQRGADSVLVCAATTSSEPARLATTIARDRGRVVVVGDVALDLDRQAMYDKELELRLSRSYGPGRYDRNYEEKGQDYPYGYVRWTQQRNMESVLELMAQGSVRLGPLITHRYPIEDAPAAFAALSAGTDGAPIGAVFAYNASEPLPRERIIRLAEPRQPPTGGPRIGLIGPGAFATGVLLPALKTCGVAPVTIAGSSSIAPAEATRRFGGEQATTEISAVIDDPAIDTVMVTSRHDSHPALVIRALQAGKNVYVEKPLAGTTEEVEDICRAYESSSGSVMVGFNRRFAPFVMKLKAFMPAAVPPMMLYRINAGTLDPQHWTLSPDDGGGRIIGEVCHFVDLMQFLAGAPVISVQARAQRNAAGLEQDLCATLTFSNGAIGTLLYTAQGTPSYPKEYLEVFAGGKVGVIDDFTTLTLVDNRRRSRQRGRQDKGFQAELSAWVAHLRDQGPCPIPFAEAVTTTLATIAIVESCRAGLPVEVTRVDVTADNA